MINKTKTLEHFQFHSIFYCKIEFKIKIFNRFTIQINYFIYFLFIALFYALIDERFRVRLVAGFPIDNGK